MSAVLDLPAASTPPGPSLGRLLLIELRKMTDTRAGRWLLGVTALIVLGTVAAAAGFAHPADRRGDAFFGLAILSTSLLVPVLGVLAATSEWSQRTALTTFTLVPRRERVVAAKLLAALALALAAAGLCLLVAVAAGALRGAEGWRDPLTHVFEGTLFEVLVVVSGFALGLALESTPGAIVTYVAAPLVILVLVGAVPGIEPVTRWLDFSSANSPLIQLDAVMRGHDWAHLATSSVLWIAVPFAVGLVRLLRREVSFA
jgi:ABC-type transport system involved in multi-copper enzyme maturation permease subunit